MLILFHKTTRSGSVRTGLEWTRPRGPHTHTQQKKKNSYKIILCQPCFEMFDETPVTTMWATHYDAARLRFIAATSP